MGSMMCHWHLDCSPRRTQGPHGFALCDQRSAKYGGNLGRGDETRSNLSHLIFRRLHSAGADVPTGSWGVWGCVRTRAGGGRGGGSARAGVRGECGAAATAAAALAVARRYACARRDRDGA